MRIMKEQYKGVRKVGKYWVAIDYYFGSISGVGVKGIGKYGLGE